jgi:hypothetical protein
VSSNGVKKVTVKQPLRLIKHDALKAYGAIAAHILKFATDRASRFGHFIPGKGFRYSLSRGLDGPRGRYSVLEKRNRVSKYDT